MTTTGESTVKLPALALYLAPGSSSMAPHIALHEIGVPFETRLVSLKKRETRTPEYLAMNPDGKVPTLLIDGRALTEVAGILFYLGKRFPEAKLLPDDTEGQARAVSWMSFIASTVHPARRQGDDHARKIYGAADGLLAGKDWALGTYSIADIHMFRLYWRFRNSVKPAAAEFPNLTRLYDRMMDRPAVRRTCEIEAAIGYELPA